MDHDFDVDDFLQKPLLAHLATASGDGPRESPVWFLWEAGARWLVGTRMTAPKRLRASPDARSASERPPNGVLRHVGIRGVATIEPLDRPRLYRMLRRYLGEDQQAWNHSFRARVIDRLELMVRISPESLVARNQSYFSSSHESAQSSGRAARSSCLTGFAAATAPMSATAVTMPPRRAPRITGTRSRTSTGPAPPLSSIAPHGASHRVENRGVTIPHETRNTCRTPR